MKQCLDIFCGSSGQKVGVDKSKFYFFNKNVNHNVVGEISKVLDFNITSNMGELLRHASCT